MLYKREGLPEESELVLCTVTKIFHNCVFVELDEFGLDGMIHISEVSPGRIRNIRDFVKEGKKVVCKVLRVNKEKLQVDLSLRRVNAGQRREKVNEIKQEQKSEKIVEFISKDLKKDFTKLYHEVAPKILARYLFLYQCFDDIVKDGVKLEDLGIEKKTAKKLTEIIKQRIKPAEIVIGGDLVLSSYAPDGVEIIKKALKKAKLNDSVDIRYKGAGKYSVSVKAADYKEAEKILKQATENAINSMDKGSAAEFIRK